jgi:hypothetical protein
LFHVLGKRLVQVLYGRLAPLLLHQVVGNISCRSQERASGSSDIPISWAGTWHRGSATAVIAVPENRRPASENQFVGETIGTFDGQQPVRRFLLAALPVALAFGLVPSRAPGASNGSAATRWRAGLLNDPSRAHSLTTEPLIRAPRPSVDV